MNTAISSLPYSKKPHKLADRKAKYTATGLGGHSKALGLDATPACTSDYLKDLNTTLREIRKARGLIVYVTNTADRNGERLLAQTRRILARQHPTIFVKPPFQKKERKPKGRAAKRQLMFICDEFQAYLTPPTNAMASQIRRQKPLIEQALAAIEQWRQVTKNNCRAWVYIEDRLQQEQQLRAQLELLPTLEAVANSNTQDELDFYRLSIGGARSGKTFMMITQSLSDFFPAGAQP